jgi:hypothetical protein
MDFIDELARLTIEMMNRVAIMIGLEEKETIILNVFYVYTIQVNKIELHAAYV